MSYVDNFSFISKNIMVMSINIVNIYFFAWIFINAIEAVTYFGISVALKGNEAVSFFTISPTVLRLAHTYLFID